MTVTSVKADFVVDIIRCKEDGILSQPVSAVELGAAAGTRELKVSFHYLGVSCQMSLLG